MQPQLGAALGMLIALSWTDLAAQEKSSTCSLLTAADINAAVGAKVGEPHRTDMGIAPGAARKTNGDGNWGHILEPQAEARARQGQGPARQGHRTLVEAGGQADGRYGGTAVGRSGGRAVDMISP